MNKWDLSQESNVILVSEKSVFDKKSSNNGMKIDYRSKNT
jgi:hypothetical protein